MNKFKFYFILSITSLLIISCSTTDDSTIDIENYADQYPIDNAEIETYLTTHYISNIDSATLADDGATFETITDATTQASIMSYLNATTYPSLKTRECFYHGVNYTIYYLVLREGTGESPCNVDSVFAAYAGSYIYESTDTDTEETTLETYTFETVIYPQSYINLASTIRGWSEIFPQFKSGTNTVNDDDGTITHTDYGSGTIFIPSGLGYYYYGSTSIPAYSQLIFNFKLYDVQRNDQDGDGIDSYLEDLDGDGYMYYYTNTDYFPTEDEDGNTIAYSDELLYADDEDQDGFPNYIDYDDDGDGTNTVDQTTDRKR
jgi:FKBP-type peptidyl-prolyl cis-trans isomerase FkpA